MEEKKTVSPGEPSHPCARAAGLGRKDLALLLLLLLLAAGVRIWLFCHTEVAARDSIGFIGIAWKFQHEPWRAVLAQAEQHPGYPLLILLASGPVRCFVHGPDALTMQLSAQLVSVLTGTLLVVPMYYLGRELFNRTVGFWAAVFFQFLPASCRVLSDGLSEATFLLLAATALYLAVVALRLRSPLLFALCGLCSGLAYLTRPEGALIAAATAAVLVGLQLFPSRRQPGHRFLLCSISLTLAAVLMGGPLVALTGKLTLKPGINDSLKNKSPLQPDGTIHEPWLEVRGSSGEKSSNLLFASVPPIPFAVWRPDGHGPVTRPILWGLWALRTEFNKGFYYTGWIPAIVGLWWFRRRFLEVPGIWVLALVCLAVTLCLWRVATMMGYLSDRHMALIVLCGSYWAVALLTALGQGLGNLLAASETMGQRLGPQTAGRLLTGLLLLAAIGPALPKALEPLHVNRSGFRAAGLWLAEQMQSGDTVLDPYCWTEYYSGVLFRDSETGHSPGRSAVQYVVLDHCNPHRHLHKHRVAETLAQQGRPVYHWSGHYRKQFADITIYAVPVAP